MSINKLNGYVHYLMENKIMKNRETEANCEWCSLKITASEFWKKKKKKKLETAYNFGKIFEKYLWRHADLTPATSLKKNFFRDIFV